MMDRRDQRDDSEHTANRIERPAPAEPVDNRYPVSGEFMRNPFRRVPCHDAECGSATVTLI